MPWRGVDARIGWRGVEHDGLECLSRAAIERDASDWMNGDRGVEPGEPHGGKGEVPRRLRGSKHHILLRAARRREGRQWVKKEVTPKAN